MSFCGCGSSPAMASSGTMRPIHCVACAGPTSAATSSAGQGVGRCGVVVAGVLLGYRRALAAAQTWHPGRWLTARECRTTCPRQQRKTRRLQLGCAAEGLANGRVRGEERWRRACAVRGSSGSLSAGVRAVASAGGGGPRCARSLPQTGWPALCVAVRRSSRSSRTVWRRGAWCPRSCSAASEQPMVGSDGLQPGGGGAHS